MSFENDGSALEFRLRRIDSCLVLIPLSRYVLDALPIRADIAVDVVPASLLLVFLSGVVKTPALALIPRRYLVTAPGRTSPRLLGVERYGVLPTSKGPRSATVHVLTSIPAMLHTGTIRP